MRLEKWQVLKCLLGMEFDSCTVLCLIMYFAKPGASCQIFKVINTEAVLEILSVQHTVVIFTMGGIELSRSIALASGVLWVFGE